MQLHELNAKTDSLVSDFRNFRANFTEHVKALAIHVEKHGDVTAVTYLVRKLETEDAKGLNLKAVSDWFNAWTKASIKYDAKAKCAEVKYAKDRRTVLSQGTATDENHSDPKYKEWFDYNPAPIGKGWDMEEQIQQLIGIANKKMRERAKLIKDGKIDEAEKIYVSDIGMAALKRTLAEVQGNKALPSDEVSEEVPALLADQVA